MKTTTWKLIAITLLSVTLLSCGGKTEDVRISLCRDLSTNLVDLEQTPQWLDMKTYIKRPAYARISLAFKANAGNYKAACYFEYDAREENVITHTDPLSAYDTLPYKMTINGKNVPKRIIHDAVNAIVKKKGKALLEKAKSEFQKVLRSS